MLFGIMTPTYCSKTLATGMIYNYRHRNMCNNSDSTSEVSVCTGQYHPAKIYLMAVMSSSSTTPGTTSIRTNLHKRHRLRCHERGTTRTAGVSDAHGGCPGGGRHVPAVCVCVSVYVRKHARVGMRVGVRETKGQVASLSTKYISR